MNIVNAILSETENLPPIAALGYEYVVAANGLFIRAEDSRMEACVPVADGFFLPGLVSVEPYARLKVPPIPAAWLHSILKSARKHLPAEVMYQFGYTDKWTCSIPQTALASPVSLVFDDQAQAVVDLHSHGTLDAFFSTTDDGDEQGLRFYCVVGKVDTDTPEILCRVGVYGQHMEVPVTTIFDGAGPFVDVFEREAEREGAEASQDLALVEDETESTRVEFLASRPEEN